MKPADYFCNNPADRQITRSHNLSVLQFTVGGQLDRLMPHSATCQRIYLYIESIWHLFWVLIYFLFIFFIFLILYMLFMYCILYSVSMTKNKLHHKLFACAVWHPVVSSRGQDGHWCIGPTHRLWSVSVSWRTTPSRGSFHHTAVSQRLPAGQVAGSLRARSACWLCCRWAAEPGLSRQHVSCLRQGLFATLRQGQIWGYLHNSEADSVRNLVRFIQQVHRFS